MQISSLYNFLFFVLQKHLSQNIRRVLDIFCCALTEQGVVPVPANCMSMYPAKISTHLSQWRRSTYQDFTVGDHC